MYKNKYDTVMKFNYRQPSQMFDILLQNTLVEHGAITHIVNNTSQSICFDKDFNPDEHYVEAVNCSDSKGWKSAMDEEMRSLIENTTYKLTSTP